MKQTALNAQTTAKTNRQSCHYLTAQVNTSFQCTHQLFKEANNISLHRPSLYLCIISLHIYIEHISSYQAWHHLVKQVIFLLHIPSIHNAGNHIPSSHHFISENIISSDMPLFHCTYYHLIQHSIMISSHTNIIS